MNLKKIWIRVVLITLLSGMIQSFDFLPENSAVAGTINQTGLVINYDHSSFTAGSSVVTNKVSTQPNATLRDGTGTSTPIFESFSRTYFTTTDNPAGRNTSNVVSNNKFIYTNSAISAANFGSITNVSAFAWVFPTSLNHVDRKSVV
jgi:hypothetical protein